MGQKYIKLLRFDNEAMQYEVTYCSSGGAKQIPATQFAQNVELVSVSGADYLVGIENSTELLRLSNGVESCSSLFRVRPVLTLIKAGAQTLESQQIFVLCGRVLTF